MPKAQENHMIKTKKDLQEYLDADKRALGRTGKRPRFDDVIWKYEILLRKCEYYGNTGGLLNKILGSYYRYRRFKLGLLCGFGIRPNTCGKGLCLAHVGPIIINGKAQIGEYCKIHVGVNIGADARKRGEFPVIGNHVYIAPGAKIFGNITIGDYVAIGANAVVNKSFPMSNVTIAGIPAKIINEKGVKDILE